MKIDNRKTLLTSLILSSILLFHLINTYIWLKLDHTYLISDPHDYFLSSLKVYNAINNNLFPGLNYILGITSTRWHGIFLSYITAPLYFIFGPTQDSGIIISNIIFFPTLILSTYKIGKLISDRKSGIISAFLVSMYPLIFNHLRIYMLDLPLTAIIALSIYILLKTKNFSNKVYTFFFGLCLAAGILIKFNYIGFITWPFLVILRSVKTKRTFKHIAVALLLTLILTIAFLKIKFWEIFFRLYECSWFYPRYSALYKSSYSLFLGWLYTGIKFLLWHIKELVNSSVTTPFLIAFFFGLFYIAKNKIPYRNILLSWILFPLLLLSFAFHYPVEERYIMPALVPIAIISAIGIANIRNKISMVIIIVLLSVFGTIQYLSLSYKLSFMPDRVQIQVPQRIFGLQNNLLDNIIFFRQDVDFYFRNTEKTHIYPTDTKWPVEDIIKIINNNLGPSYLEKDVFFVDDLREVSQPMEYLSLLNNYNINVHMVKINEEKLYLDTSIAFDLRNDADYVLIQENNDLTRIDLDERFKKAIMGSRDNFFNKSIVYFDLIDTVNLPERQKLLIFKNKRKYAKIGKYPLELFAGNGKIKLYCENKPINSKKGLCSAFIYKGIELKSYKADWSVSKNQSGISLNMRWKNVPVIEKWYLAMPNTKELIVKINISAQENIVLTNHYLALIFPDIFTVLKERPLIKINTRGLKKISKIKIRPHSDKYTVEPFIVNQNNDLLLAFKISNGPNNTLYLSATDHDIVELNMCFE